MNVYNVPFLLHALTGMLSPYKFYTVRTSMYVKLRTNEQQLMCKISCIPVAIFPRPFLHSQANEEAWVRG